MEAPAQSTAFWNQAAGKVFTHPLDAVRLAQSLERDARILDFGCGPGRLCAELLQLGYQRVTGIDFSPAMIDAARSQVPGAQFIVNDGAALPFPDASLDAVLLFAVLTCIPADEAQMKLLAEFRRTLRRGGLLVVSDYPLQLDARNRQRYERFAPQLGYGRFRIEGGALLRHHRREWLDELLADFRVEHAQEIDVLTMNGNPARIVQLWGRKAQD